MIRTYVDDYVTRRRAVGYKFRIQNSLLTNFARFADQRNDQFIKTDTVLEWSKQAPSPAQKRNRLLTIRRFALSLHAEDSRHQIPPSKAFGHYCRRRRKPYIYSEIDVKTLLQAASRLTPRDSIRAQTFITLISLLYVSGLRISEALALNMSDISEDGLIIRATKFNKDRLVPIHASTRTALERYLSSRCKHVIAADDAVFISSLGSRLA
ncbi:MAG: tyrosine-type recombinase/integrase, partial [Aestuariibacter sp.]|nr:tyrosine-type recombinase/integrase [Aestuariibacter sp.]